MRIPLAAALTLASVLSASAQDQPAIPRTAVKPDPTHASFILPKDLKWKRESLGQLQAPLYGDPDKPGPYGILIKWPKGEMSHPHFHTTDRYIYVVSGTWWVSSSTHYDPGKMYPIPAGTFVTDIKNTIHWDGAKAETGPCILMLVGEGPMTSGRYVAKDPSKPDEGQDFVAKQ